MRTRKKIKIRKSIRYFCLASVIVILVASCAHLFKVLLATEDISVKNEEIYSYENKFNYDYKVNLIKNPYIEKEYLDMNENAYITDLIQSIDLNLNYKYQGNVESNIDYEYSVKGYLNATYTKDGEEQKVWQKEYKLVDTKKETNKSNTIDLQEKLKINLKEQNNLVKQFEQDLGINLDAKYLIVLNIKTTTEVEGEKVDNTYASSLNIDLAEKTTKISGDNNKQDKKYISKEIEQQLEFNIVSIFISVALIVFSVLQLRYIFRKTISTNHIKNEYRQELNRILRLCQDKIVQVSTPVDMKNERIEIGRAHV